MKRIVSIFVFIAVAVSVCSAMAAGSCVKKYNLQEEVVPGIKTPAAPVYECTSDAADGTIADLLIPGLTGQLQAFDVKFDGTVPPTSVAVVPKTVFGNAIDLTGTGTLTTTGGYVALETPKGFAGGLKLSFTVVGNAKKFLVAPIIF